MIRPILKYGDPVLHAEARTVEAMTPEIDRLIDDMVETMYAAPGVGLAAPQVGVGLRLFVVDLSLGRDPQALIVMVNPEFVSRDGMQLEDEGCLSVPGFNATVVRPDRAVVKGLDRTGAERRNRSTSSSRAALLRSFSAGGMRSTSRMPSRWSYSCCTIRPGKPSNVSSSGSPRGEKALTVQRSGRSISA